jgi:hypothetical protein
MERYRYGPLFIADGDDIRGGAAHSMSGVLPMTNRCLQKGPLRIDDQASTGEDIR